MLYEIDNDFSNDNDLFYIIGLPKIYITMGTGKMHSFLH